jgi:hypothetical protein
LDTTSRLWRVIPLYRGLLRVIFGDDVGVIGVDDDPDVRAAPLGVVSGAVVGVVTGSRGRPAGGQRRAQRSGQATRSSASYVVNNTNHGDVAIQTLPAPIFAKHARGFRIE